MGNLARYIVNIFGNVAVIGVGLGIYDQRWVSLLVAAVALGLGAFIAWRTDDRN